MRIRRNGHRGWWAAPLVVALLAGCDGGSSAVDADDVTTFEVEPSLVIADAVPDDDRPSAALHGDVAFHQETDAVAAYAADGTELARVEPERPLRFDGQDPTARYQSPPVIADADGSPVVIAGFAVEPEDGATQLDVELMILDADTADVHWQGVIREPGRVQMAPREDAAVTVEGVEDGIAVIGVTHDGATQVTFGLTIDGEPEVIWSDTELSAVGVHDGVAAGFGAEGLVGIEVEDGSQAWASDLDANGIGPAGPWIIATENAGEPDARTRMVSFADGAEHELGDEDVLTDAMYCNADEGSAVLVCSEPDAAAVALDLDSGDLLWSDDDWDGALKAVLGGVAYVEQDDAAIAVDARTGEVVLDDVGAAPAIATDLLGVDRQDTDVVLHPAQ